MKFSKNSIAVLTVFFVFVVLGLIGPIAAHAATTPSLGTAATYGILTGTFNYNVGLTTITGIAGTAALGYAGVAQGGGASLAVTGTTQVNNLAWSTAGTDQGTALTALAAQSCGNGTTIPGYTFADGAIDLAIDTTHGTVRHYSPGVYCVTGAMSVGTAGIVLDSAGTYIFRSTGAFNTVTGSVVSSGASACNVFWTPGAATILAANTTFVGTVIDNAGITIGNTVLWEGRALAYAAGSGVVTADTDTITAPTCAASTATLTLVKTITKDNGGSATVDQWTLAAAGSTPISGATGSGTVTNAAVTPGTYTLSESGGPAGYTASTYSCVTNGGAPVVSNSITLIGGDNATCTINNNDNAATLIVKKVVVNDSGGALNATNFSFSVNAGATQIFEADGQNDLPVDAGTYTITEPAVAGYLATYNNCSSLVIPNGGSATCTITNDDIAPQLIVIKTIINDNNGTITNFPLFIDGFSVISGVASTTSIGPHTVSETADPGYTAVIGGHCAADGTITLSLGDIKTCTITNDDIAPVVPPPSGGTGGGSYYAPVPPLIDVVKVPEPLALPAGPGTVTYTYTLRNIGTVPATNITMVGDTCSPITLVSGDTNADAKLDVNEIWTYRCSATLSATHTNTITATGWANGISAVDIASATVVVGAPVVPPLIHLVKKPSVFALAAPGGAVTYTYTVTNPGTAPLSDVSITDDKCTGLPGRVSGHPGDINKNDLLESNETWSFTCQSELTQTTTNTGTAEGSANGLIAKDFAIATVVVANVDPALLKAAATVIPMLPKVGFAPPEKSILWNIIIPSGILILVLASLAVVSRLRRGSGGQVKKRII